MEQRSLSAVKRSAYLDVIKGIAIFLVVLAHSVQWGSGRTFYEQVLYFSDPLFKVIYGFHMPLFMVVSGYLFHGTLQRHSATGVFVSRLRVLLLPIATWQTLYLAVLLAAGEIVLSASLLYTYKGALWFLWSVLFCSVMVLAGRCWFRDSWLYYAVAVVALLFVPDKLLTGLHVFMFPYFVGGYWWGKLRAADVYRRMSSGRKAAVALAALAVFMLLYFVYDTPAHSVYHNGTCLLGRESLLGQASIDAARYAYGWAGVVAVMVFTDLLMSSAFLHRAESLLTYLGRNTLGIYIVNYFTVLLMPFAVAPWIDGSAASGKAHIVIALAETVVMLAIAIGVVRLIRCGKTARLLLLGEK